MNQFRRIVKVLVGILVLALAGINTVIAKTAAVTGTKHDLTINHAISGGLGPCGYCHGALRKISNVPLWERAETATLFTLYTSKTISSNVDKPGTMSLACLSCHDGVMAYDALNGSNWNAEDDMNYVYEGIPEVIGTFVCNNHPIGVDITAGSIGIRNKSEITDAGLKVYESKVECASCHEAHDSDGHAPFLRMSNDNSALCLGCHIK